MMFTADVALVACVKTKADHPVPAKDLYVSPWFRMARAYAERRSERWFILSAAYGLVHPYQVTAPYNETLNRMKLIDKRIWADRVRRQLEASQVRGHRVLVLAGMNYREWLYPYLMANFQEMDIPMAGLMMGQQLSWLSRNLQ
jgi:hypothetical protein